MLRTIRTNRKNALKPGQTVDLWNGMPDQMTKETYRIIKLVRYSRADEIGEYEVKPVSVSKDPGNLMDKRGRPSPGLR